MAKWKKTKEERNTQSNESKGESAAKIAARRGEELRKDMEDSLFGLGTTSKGYKYVSYGKSVTIPSSDIVPITKTQAYEMFAELLEDAGTLLSEGFEPVLVFKHMAQEMKNKIDKQ